MPAAAVYQKKKKKKKKFQRLLYSSGYCIPAAAVFSG
jgi:hypothetical protein